MTPDSQERRTAMFKDNKLRLLMTLAGFERLGIDDEPDVTWIIPSTISARELHESCEIIEKHCNNPTFEYGDEDPMTAEEMLRRVPAAKAQANYDDDSEADDIISVEEEDFLFRPGGPTETNPKTAVLDELKKKRRKRRTAASGDEDGGISDDTRRDRQRAKLLGDRANERKMKSKFFVRDSDDDSNEELDMEFFAREEAIRKGQADRVLEALVSGKANAPVMGKKRKSEIHGEGKRKRTKSSPALSDSEDVETADEDSSSSPHRQRSVSRGAYSLTTPLSSPRVGSSQENGMADPIEVAVDSSQEPVWNKVPGLTLNEKLEADSGVGVGAVDEDEDDVPPAPSGRRRKRMALLDDSDEE